MSFESPEDQKLYKLADATLQRTGATQAAALRDTHGRTYVGINIDMPGLQLSALDAVFATAMASQISGIEAAVVVGQKPEKVGALTHFAPNAEVFFVDADGEVKLS